VPKEKQQTTFIIRKMFFASTLICSGLLASSVEALSYYSELPSPPICNKLKDGNRCHHFKGEATETTSFFAHDIRAGQARDYTTRVLAYYQLSSDLELLLYDHQLNRNVKLTYQNSENEGIVQACVPDGKYEWFIRRKDKDYNNDETLFYNVWFAEDYQSHVICQVGDEGEFANADDPEWAKEDMEPIDKVEMDRHEKEEPYKPFVVPLNENSNRYEELSHPYEEDRHETEEVNHLESKLHEEDRHETEKVAYSESKIHEEDRHEIEKSSKLHEEDRHENENEAPDLHMPGMSEVNEAHVQHIADSIIEKITHEIMDKHTADISSSDIADTPKQPHIPSSVDFDAQNDDNLVTSSKNENWLISYNVMAGLVITSFVIIMLTLVTLAVFLVTKCCRNEKFKNSLRKKRRAADRRIDTLDDDDDDDNEIVCVAPGRLPSVYQNSKPIPQVPEHCITVKPVESLKRSPVLRNSSNDDVVVVLNDDK